MGSWAGRKRRRIFSVIGFMEIGRNKEKGLYLQDFKAIEKPGGSLNEDLFSWNRGITVLAIALLLL